MRKTIARGVAGAAVAVAALAGIAPAAGANVNIWNDANFSAGNGSAHFGNHVPNYASWVYPQNGRNIDNTVSSLNTDGSAFTWTVWWTDANCRGSGYSVLRNDSRSYVGDTFNDRFSSHAEEWRGQNC